MTDAQGLTEYAILVDRHGDVTLTEARHAPAIMARDPSERVVSTAWHATWYQAKEWRERFTRRGSTYDR